MIKFTKLKIKKMNFQEIMICMLFILPYFERGNISSWLKIQNINYTWRAILTIEIILFILLICLKRYLLGKTCFPILRRNVLVFSGYILFNVIYSTVLYGKVMPALTLALMIVFPLINALVVFRIIEANGLNCTRIIVNSVYIYTLFVAFTFFYNILFLGMSFRISNNDNSARMVASAGGVVTLGYSIAIVLTFLFVNKECFSLLAYYCCFCILAIGILYTQSRGGIVVLAIIVFVELILNKLYSVILVVWGIVCHVMGMNVINTLVVRSMAFSSLLNNHRVITAIHSTIIWVKNIWPILIGYGLNGFYPYQYWLATTVHSDVYVKEYYNRFFHSDSKQWLLVQPHNSFNYLAIETGILGCLLFVMIFISIYNGVSVNSKKQILFLIMCIFLINIFESTFILEPGIACIWWIVLFISGYQKKDKAYE